MESKNLCPCLLPRERLKGETPRLRYAPQGLTPDSLVPFGYRERGDNSVAET